MKNMLRHIEYLVIRHDCVIVPGLGAFIAAFEPARVEEGRIIPPRRSVRFNSDITHNDGLLAASISRRDGIGYDMSVAAINENVFKIKTLLADGDTLNVGRVGTLCSADNGALLFSPDDDNIASLRFRGLPEVVTAVNEGNIFYDNSVVDDSKKENIVYIPVHKAIIRIAAAVAILFGVGILCSTPNILDDTTIMASLNPGNALKDVTDSFIFKEDTVKGELTIAKPASRYESSQLVDTIGRNWYQKFMAKHSAQKEETVDNSNDKDTKTTATSTLDRNTTGEYCVVVASLPTLARAQKWVKANGDGTLKILSQEGRYRVIITSADTEDSAKTIASSSKIQKKYPGAWVTRR